jgi:hypothetical protein
MHDLENQVRECKSVYEVECIVPDQGALGVVPAVPAICR